MHASSICWCHACLYHSGAASVCFSFRTEVCVLVTSSLGVVSGFRITDNQCHKHLWSFSDCPTPVDA